MGTNMAWNQPGNNGRDRDPWGKQQTGSNSGSGNKGEARSGTSRLDDIFRKLSTKLGGFGGGKGTGSGGGSSSQVRPQLGGRIVAIAAAAVVIILGGQRFLYH